MVSSYLPYDDAVAPTDIFQKVVNGAKENGRELVIGADANAHHSVWGSTDINKRGELLFDYILTTNLIICNKGNKPTFTNKVRQQVIDVTFARTRCQKKSLNGSYWTITHSLIITISSLNSMRIYQEFPQKCEKY